MLREIARSPSMVMQPFSVSAATVVTPIHMAVIDRRGADDEKIDLVAGIDLADIGAPVGSTTSQ